MSAQNLDMNIHIALFIITPKRKPPKLLSTDK